MNTDQQFLTPMTVEPTEFPRGIALEGVYILIANNRAEFTGIKDKYSCLGHFPIRVPPVAPVKTRDEEFYEELQSRFASGRLGLQGVFEDTIKYCRTTLSQRHAEQLRSFQRYLSTYRAINETAEIQQMLDKLAAEWTEGGPAPEPVKPISELDVEIEITQERWDDLMRTGMKPVVAVAKMLKKYDAKKKLDESAIRQDERRKVAQETMEECKRNGYKTLGDMARRAAEERLHGMSAFISDLGNKLSALLSEGTEAKA